MFGHKLLIILVSLIYITECQSQSYDDKRCKCICLNTLSAINITRPSTERFNFVSNVPPNNCNCEDFILPQIKNPLHGQELVFCSRCECKYENRNTTIIKFVVIIVVWVISLLVIYMLFLICLEPILNKRIRKNAGSSYQEHTNEEDDTVSAVAGTSSHPMGVRGNVLNRVGHQQDKWKRQVREQRRNIYDRHTMLN